MADLFSDIQQAQDVNVISRAIEVCARHAAFDLRAARLVSELQLFLMDYLVPDERPTGGEVPTHDSMAAVTPH